MGLCSNIDIKRLQAPELMLGWKAPIHGAVGSSVFAPPTPPSTKRRYYKALLPWQYNRVGTEKQTCCLNVCWSVATVYVTTFSLAILTSCRVVLIGCLNWRPCHGQSQFVYVIFTNMVYRRRVPTGNIDVKSVIYSALQHVACMDREFLCYIKLLWH